MNLGSRRTLNELSKDNYTHVNFNYIQFKSLYQDCFSLGKDCNVQGTWKTLLGLYNESTQTTNAIHSTEAFAHVPQDPYTTLHLQSLQKHFRIRIILVYRHVHEWLPSQYHQHEKSKFFMSRSGRYRRWGGEERISFVDFFEDYFFHMEDSLHVRDKYVKFFGETAVTVMPMPNNTLLLSEFYCHALPNANNTCNMARDIERRKGGHGVIGNPSSQFLFEHDRLITKARNLLPNHLKNQRHAATVALQKRLAQLNLTTSDMPQECLSPLQQEALWNRTWLTEQTVAPKPISRDELYQSFQDSREKFCSINVTATLQNETWRNIITSIGIESKS